MPPDPCRHCSLIGSCQLRGTVNRLALKAWVEDRYYDCPDYSPQYYRGIEGVFA